MREAGVSFRGGLGRRLVASPFSRRRRVVRSPLQSFFPISRDKGRNSKLALSLRRDGNGVWLGWPQLVPVRAQTKVYTIG